MEVVFVELPYKTCEVAMLEMLGKDMLGEFLVLLFRQWLSIRSRSVMGYLEDHEAIALISPSHNAFILRALQHSAKVKSVRRRAQVALAVCLLVQLAHLLNGQRRVPLNA